MTMTFEDVQASYGRCLRDKEFISRFYELLLARDPGIQRMFQNTNWGQQQRALRRGISIALTYASGSAIVERSMNEMAEVHSRAGRAPVDPMLYVHWRESLLEAIKAFDPKMNSALHEQWGRALKVTTDHFTAHY